MRYRLKQVIKTILLTRTSTIQALGMYTTRRQNVEVLDATIFFPKEEYIFTCQLSHSFYPDKYWGIGSNSKEFPKIKLKDKSIGDYDFEQLYFFPHLKKKLQKIYL